MGSSGRPHACGEFPELVPTTNRPPKPRRLRRVVPAVLALTSLATLSAGPAVAAGATASISLADWNDPYAQGQSGAGGWYAGGRGSDPWGSGSSGSDNSSGSGTTATAAESKGVVLIDTVLGYSNAA